MKAMIQYYNTANWYYIYLNKNLNIIEYMFKDDSILAISYTTQ